MELEIKDLHQNGTWELVPLLPAKKIAGCKWVYTVKFNPNGLVERLKARLVAKGYIQTYGFDFDETFSLVAKISSVCFLISLAANLNWPLFQLDIKNAFYMRKFVRRNCLGLLLRGSIRVVFVC
jgi:hypothetical protein